VCDEDIGEVAVGERVTMIATAADIEHERDKDGLEQRKTAHFM
jgi:hypothetical protein